MFIELINIMDIFISFCRGYYNFEEQLIYRKRKIIKHYLGEWFLFDLISAIPVYSLNKLQKSYCNDIELNSIHYSQILNKPINHIIYCFVIGYLKYLKYLIIIKHINIYQII